MPRLYREAPLNSIWEGSGNVICLDVLRALHREPAVAPALLAELEGARGADGRLDAALDGPESGPGRPGQPRIPRAPPDRAHGRAVAGPRFWCSMPRVRWPTPSAPRASASAGPAVSARCRPKRILPPSWSAPCRTGRVLREDRRQRSPSSPEPRAGSAGRWPNASRPKGRQRAGARRYRRRRRCGGRRSAVRRRHGLRRRRRGAGAGPRSGSGARLTARSISSAPTPASCAPATRTSPTPTSRTASASTRWRISTPRGRSAPGMAERGEGYLVKHRVRRRHPASGRQHGLYGEQARRHRRGGISCRPNTGRKASRSPCSAPRGCIPA